jgi:tetratricopeptide (TPR) repeat protein
LKILTAILFIYTFFPLNAQVFQAGELQEIVRKGADHIYNSKPDSANVYIKKVEQVIPDHPVVPLMKAMTLLWSNIPTISGEVFTTMERQLDSAIFLARKKDPNLKDPEMMFFAMSAHGLLAEYYADQDFTMKAVSEANRAYGLLKQGFDLVEDYPEYLFTTGLYNYFREKYPEKHPIYKPLLWFFKSGDKKLGLYQLEKATTETFLTKVEAHVYLSYIYLRYEYKPEKAQEYLSKLCEMYPNNYYAKAKYLESLANPDDFGRVPPILIYSLITHESSYYKLAGYVFLGYYEESVVKNPEKAEFAYRKGLEYGNQIPHHGEFFKSFGYLGLGRLLVNRDATVEAEKTLNMALEYAETEQVEMEAKKLLSGI